MADDLLLIGSIPYETAEDVFRNFGTPLGPYLRAMPDGEVGDRRWWVQRINYQVLNGHPWLEPVNRPKTEPGAELLMPRDRDEMWRFQVKDGVERVTFDEPGWRLGFARDAIASYFVFRTLREQGIVPQGLRFQVSLPLVNSVVRPATFPRQIDRDRVRDGYEAAVAAEIAKIVEKIPAEDLALQWDLASEIIDVYGAEPALPREGAIDRNVGQVAALSRAVPKGVELGIHFCFGTFGGWPRFEPADLGPAVDYANACVESAGRPLDWIHLPAIDTTSPAFYAPLSRLDPKGARVYLGLVHNMASYGERLKIARSFLPDFGVAAYCGLGRNPVETLPQTLQDHVDAVEMARRS